MKNTVQHPWNRILTPIDKDGKVHSACWRKKNPDKSVVFWIFTVIQSIFELQREKTNNVDSDQVWLIPGCTATGDG